MSELDSPAATPAVHRVIGIVSVVIAVAVAIGLATTFPNTPPPPIAVPVVLPAGFPIDYWDWGVNRTLSTAERQALDRLGGQDVFSLCGLIRPQNSEWAWEPQGRASVVIPGRRQHLVVRIDAGIARQMDPAAAEKLIPLIVAGCARNSTTATVGVQLDADVPTKRLAAYAGLLQQLRAALPAGTHLSVTMLLDWARSPDLAAVMNAVDTVVPQFYNTYLPIDFSGRTPLVGANDLERVIPKLEAIGRPYRIGLPTYEQCSQYDATGDMKRAALALSPEQALTAGGVAEQFRRGDENLLTVRFAQVTKISAQFLDAGHVLMFASSTPNGLARRLADVRRLRPRHCAGIVLFRLPGRESTHTLTISQVEAAANNRVRPALVVARLEPLGNQHHALIVSNQGDEDFLDFTHPARVVIQAPGAELRATQLPGYGFTVARELPTADGKHDGLELYVGLLRAGEVLTIEDLLITTKDGSGPRIHGVVQQNGRSERIIIP